MAGDLLGIGFEGLVPGPLWVEAGPKGTTCHWTVSCLTQGPLIAYYNYIVQFGATVTVKGADVGVDGITTAEVKELEISFPGLVSTLVGVLSELFFDQWELITNESSDTIFANPLIVGTNEPGGGGTTPILNYNDKTVLSRLSRDGGTLAAAIANCNSDVTAGLLTAPTVGTGPFGGGMVNPAGGTPLFQQPGEASPADVYGGNAPRQLALEIQKGQSDYEAPTYVLRHTSYCSAQAYYNDGVANTQKIYSPAQLLTEVGSGWTYNLPNRLYSKIASIPFQYAAQEEQPYYTWGWLKKITRESLLANFVVEVSTEYELGLWSNLRYGLYGS